MLDNLENGVTYGYTLKNVVNTGNIEVKSDTSDLSLVLPAATGLNPELEAITDHGMHLAWSPSTTQGLQSYRITVLDNAGNAVLVNDIPPTDSSFTLVGLTEGTSYELVLDEIVNGESKYAGVANGITKTPQNVELNGASAHTITVSWNTALTDTAEGYLVNVISQDGSYTSLILVDVASAAAPYTITGLPSGLAYEVGVDAVFAGARLQLGALTDPANTTAPSLIPRVGAITKHGIHLTWTPSTASSLGGYRITLLDSTGKTVRFGPFGASTTSLTLLGLTAGLEYQATFDEVVVLPRNVVSHGVTDRTVTVSWDTSLFGAAEGYLISVISKDGSYTRLVPVDVASSGDPYILMLPKAKIYEVGVDAVIDGQRVALGALADPISTDGQPMEISVSVAAVGTDMIQVMWEAYDGATYSLHITNLGNGNTRQIVLPSQATTYTFQELVAGQPYNIMLNIHLNDLDMLSDSINATTRPLPPTDVKIRSCGSYTLIAWGPPPHIPSNIYNGYRIGFVEIDGTMTVKDLPVGRTRLDLPVGYSGTNICLSTISAGRVSQPDPAGPCQSILDF
ncbi:tenascin-N-like isoform X2 [Patiria miniata]|uniref:Fibronectin type-III domain-containing protein n=1 Tax=Patiria miniata TaxID=46514 RepID=A0A913ZQR3_PATMI|nr:tenascin-N-like isoform X2 [Patiria miniata]